MINQGNDLDLAPPILLPLSEARAQVRAGNWAGGVNLTALALAEQRAYGYYWEIMASAEKFLPNAAPYLILNRTSSGTPTGLSKMPYLREARRGQFGVEGFRLCSAPLAVGGEGDPGCWRPPPRSARRSDFGYKFKDTVAIGQYNFDIHHMVCAYPAYLETQNHAAAKYYIPFRALTSWDSPNLLLAGKNIAQTFFANAATRLHPEECVVPQVHTKQ